MNIKNSLTHTQKYKSILSAVHMVYRLVNSTYNLNELSLRLTRLLCNFIKADSSSVLIFDPQKNKFLLKAIFNNKINILLTKRRELNKRTPDEERVMKGFSVMNDHFIGLPLVADENIGCIFVNRLPEDPPFEEYDKEILQVISEQAVTAIRNLQLYEEQQQTILSSIKLIRSLLEQQGQQYLVKHMPVYFKIVKAMAEKLNMSQSAINNLYYATILRDAGAIDVPYEILSKTSQLSPEEFKIIRNQPTRAAELIRPVDFLKPVLPIILYHHEKWDGSGYPSGLRKEQIPSGARILSIVNAFDAMLKDRPYKKRFTVQEAIEEIQRNRGTQFDPAMVDVFMEIINQKKFINYLKKTT